MGLEKNPGGERTCASLSVLENNHGKKSIKLTQKLVVYNFAYKLMSAKVSDEEQAISLQLSLNSLLLKQV